jgi:hypothetical protein
VLVEYEIGGGKRWVDATLERRQISDCGVGLPLAVSGSVLGAPPEGSVQDNVCELTESFLLDTSGAATWLGVVFAARGAQAEALREELAAGGMEAFEKNRLLSCAERFGKAVRIGTLAYRDDRAANEFFLAETFELRDFLPTDPKTKWFKLDLANDFIPRFLKTADSGARRAPVALAHPCRITHTVELHSVALAPAMPVQGTIETGCLNFARERKTLAGNWTMRLTLQTLADAVPPEGLDEHRRALRRIEADSVWSVLLPPGDPRPRERRDFAILPQGLHAAAALPLAKSRARVPAASRSKGGVVESVTEQPLMMASTNGSANESTPAPESGPGHPSGEKLYWRRRGRRRRDKRLKGKWEIAVACLMAVTLIIIVALAAKYAEKWGIYRKQPALPKTPVNMNDQ